MFSRFFQEKYKENKDVTDFENKLLLENKDHYYDISKYYMTYLYSYRPITVDSKAYIRLKNKPEMHRHFDMNNYKPYSFIEFVSYYHENKEKFIYSNIDDINNIQDKDETKNKFKSSSLILTALHKDKVVGNHLSNNLLNKQVDYKQYKKILIDAKRNHFYNCLVQFLFLTNKPVFIK